MGNDKVYKPDDIVEAHKNFYTVHSHTDKKELLGRDHRDGQLFTVELKNITRHWTLNTSKD
ncbi:hypothetical protein BM525_19895 (plasmid) [Alteromonas mediterranea]|uniref:Uncharacterized protein n=1 Tax=Alteromonas mediterranea TaxID=314275 RepID=A0AAC9NU55_9ALTE|nr:hypothetical protein [Alteromonas mediterranea]APD92147.1 hypothetical protein BM524_19700 [Alteromonas mediterranea]APE00002.1 hypothetical protein BM525_19895 [Alteromonas mediterranea]